MAAAALLWLLPLAAAADAQSFLKNQPPRVDAAAVVSPGVAAPGGRARLEIRVTPRPDIHVYAPGNPDYIPVSVSFQEAPGVTFGTPEFPDGKDYFFAPLAEVVQVYSEAFTITQPVTFDDPLPHGAVSDGRIVIEGTVRYQACDDSVCFPPQSVTVQATVRVNGGR